MLSFISEYPDDPLAVHFLELVAKTILNLANLVDFEAKQTMMYLNPFIKDQMPLMTHFINEISVSSCRQKEGVVY